MMGFARMALIFSLAACFSVLPPTDSYPTDNYHHAVARQKKREAKERENRQKPQVIYIKFRDEKKPSKPARPEQRFISPIPLEEINRRYILLHPIDRGISFEKGYGSTALKEGDIQGKIDAALEEATEMEFKPIVLAAMDRLKAWKEDDGYYDFSDIRSAKRQVAKGIWPYTYLRGGKIVNPWGGRMYIKEDDKRPHYYYIIATEIPKRVCRDVASFRPKSYNVEVRTDPMPLCSEERNTVVLKVR